MKAAPVCRALSARGARVTLVHTGQHFDANMSKVFFEELQLPKPDRFLGMGGASRAEQFAEVVRRLAQVITEVKPDRVMVVGDVTSTAAGAVAADCCDTPVDHIEAGLRSFDLAMPEERNRRMTDALADNLFVTEESGVRHLRHEGRAEESIHLVGNCMIDTLERFRETCMAREPWKQHGFDRAGYCIVTAHRPANVDDPEARGKLLDILNAAASRMPVLFPLHPRTRQQLGEEGLAAVEKRGLELCEPLGYLKFLGLVGGAKVTITDSGGLQEETTVLNVPCIVLRENTERPAALVENGGSGILTGLNHAAVSEQLDRVIQGKYPPSTRPPLWDGHAAERIADTLLKS